jgi:hypothetical protein
MNVIKDSAVNTHSITSKAEMSDRELTTTIHCFQQPGSDAIFAVQCKTLYLDDNSEVIHKFTLTYVGFSNMSLLVVEEGTDPNELGD